MKRKEVLGLEHDLGDNREVVDLFRVRKLVCLGTTM